MNRNHSTALFAGALLAAAANANPVDGRYFDGPDCDNHGDRIAVEELGTGALFPTDERIEAIATFTQQAACPDHDDPNLPNALVVMTNLTGRPWFDLFYVGDVQTTFTNVDGFATSDEAPPPGSFLTLAFRIDAFGDNRPLVFESAAVNGIFDPGETWHFIIQDYANTLGLSPAAMASLDFAGGSFADMDSSGSIVQLVIPAPGAVALAAFSLITAARRRR